MHIAFVRSRLASLVATAACLLFVSAFCQAAGPLRWKFTAGQAFHYQANQDMNMSVDAGPAGQMSFISGQTINMTWNVKSVDDKGDALIEQRIERIRKKMSAPGSPSFDYDTDSEEPAVGIAAMVAPAMEIMTAGYVTFTMSPRGEIRDVKLSDELSSAIENGPGGESGAIDQFKSMVAQVALTLPEKPPQTGGTWTTKTAVDNPAGGNETVETTYTYDGTREADGTIYAVIKPSRKLVAAKNPSMELKMKEQKTDGEVLFDLQAGKLHSISINQNITLDLIANGQTMPGTIDQNIEITATPQKKKTATAESKVESAAK